MFDSPAVNMGSTICLGCKLCAGPIISFKAFFQTWETIERCRAVYTRSQENIGFIYVLCWHCPSAIHSHKGFLGFHLNVLLFKAKVVVPVHTHLKVKISWSEFMVWVKRKMSHTDLHYIWRNRNPNQHLLHIVQLIVLSKFTICSWFDEIHNTVNRYL